MDALANRSVHTRRNYKLQFNRFAKWMNKSPNELFDQQNAARRHDINHDDPRDGHLMEQQVKAYIAYLDGIGLSISYQKLAYATIRSFFKLNHVPLSLGGHDQPVGDNNGGSRIPSKAEIRAILEKVVTPLGKPRIQYQAAILTLKDTGLRLSDVIRLTWSGVQDLGDGFWQWQLITNKRKVRGCPVAGPETTVMLEKLPRTDDRIFPISRRTISVQMSAIMRGIDDVTPHGLRKFFYAQLQQKLPIPYIKKLMGKRTSAYDESRVEHLATAYMQNYDVLRIYERKASQAEIDKLQQQVLELQTQLHDIQQARAQTDSVMDKLIQDPEVEALLRRKIREQLRDTL
jgi:integrase